MEAVLSHVLLACVLVGGAGTLMLHPVAFPSAGHQRLSSSAYNFITNWSFFAGNLLFLVRALAAEMANGSAAAAAFVEAFDANHLSLFAFSANMIGSFGAVAAYHSSGDAAAPVAAGAAKTPAKKKTPAKRKRSSSRKNR